MCVNTQERIGRVYVSVVEYLLTEEKQPHPSRKISRRAFYP